MVKKMKKLILIMFLIILSGCFKSTPTKEVENYFTNYQINKTDINDDIIDFTNYSQEQKEEYLKIIRKNYNDLIYTIKDEEINANKAIVTIEIEVYDYSKAIKESLEYKNNNLFEFMNDDYYNESKFIDYKIKKLKEVNERIKYTLDIPLSKINDKWYIDDLNKETLEKINGIYNY